jgi:hypothetical protein
MEYGFTHILAKLKSGESVKFSFDGEEVFIRPTQNERYWILSTPLLSSQTPFSQRIQLFALSCGALHWQNFGPYLKTENEGQKISFISQEVGAKNFVGFCLLLKQFLSQAKEWRKTLQELSYEGFKKGSFNAVFAT